MKDEGPKLPIDKKWNAIGKNGNIYIISISVKQTEDKLKYPPMGIKSTFTVLMLEEDSESKLKLLIDNHEPFGFHEHTGLPAKVPRESIHASSWQEAWNIFEKKT